MLNQKKNVNIEFFFFLMVFPKNVVQITTKIKFPYLKLQVFIGPFCFLDTDSDIVAPFETLIGLKLSSNNIKLLIHHGKTSVSCYKHHLNNQVIRYCASNYDNKDNTYLPFGKHKNILICNKQHKHSYLTNLNTKIQKEKK